VNTLQKILKKAHLFANDVLFCTGLQKPERILSMPGRRILVYHGLDKKGDQTLNGRFVSAAKFDAQIRFLSQNAQIVSLDDYFSKQFDPQQFTVAITFDDGHQTNLRYALPVLEKYAAPATFFLTAAAGRGADWLWMDFLDVATRIGPPKIEIDNTVFYKKRWRHTQFFVDENGRKLVDWARYTPFSFVQKMENAFLEAGVWDSAARMSEYWALLSPLEIRELADSPYVTIGAHGHTHQDLAFIPHEEACLELRNCKATLEKISGRTIQALAYPFGAYTRALIDYAQSIGFTQQLAVDFLFPEDHTDQRLLERLVINPYISAPNQWVAIKNGRY
jgi:peptidoglycan/xylan/chitin deacetylase (PgdA/CDA1 family)